MSCKELLQHILTHPFELTTREFHHVVRHVSTVHEVVHAVFLLGPVSAEDAHEIKCTACALARNKDVPPTTQCRHDLINEVVNRE